MHDDVQVTWRATARACRAVSHKADALTVVDSRRHTNLHLSGPHLRAASGAGRAGVAHDPTPPPARHADLLEGERPLIHRHLTVATALRAYLRRGP